MLELLSCLGITLNRLRQFAAAAGITTGLLFASSAVCAAVEPDAPDGGQNQTFSEYAYVANSFYGNDFSGYKINNFTGELTQLPGSPFAPGSYYPEYGALNGLALDLKHKFLYSTVSGGATFPANVILGFSIGTKGGLTPLPTAATTGGPYQNLVVDPSDKFIYAVGPITGLNGFSIDPASGLLTGIPGADYSSSSFLSAVIADPTGRFLYVQEFFGSSLLGFQINPSTGALTEIPGSPFPNISGGLAIDPTGRFFYTFEGIGGVTVNEYLIDKHTGALTLSPHSPFSSPAGFIDVAVDPGGRFLYIADSTAEDTQAPNQLVGFSIDPVTGVLTPLRSKPVPLSAAPSRLTVDPSGKFVYVTLGNNTVAGFAIEEKSGALQPLPGPPLSTGAGPSAIAVGAFLHR